MLIKTITLEWEDHCVTSKYEYNKYGQMEAAQLTLPTLCNTINMKKIKKLYIYLYMHKIYIYIHKIYINTI